MATMDLDLGRYQLGWSDEEDYVFKPKKGLNEEIVREMSAMKHEPDWMRDFRLKSLTRFERKPMAQWFAVNMPDLDFDDIYYYIKPTGGQVKDWEDLPDSIKRTYERLGIPEAERKYLAGVTAQYECLRGSTRVWTTAGMRPIKELEPGDRVFALDERTKLLRTARVLASGSSGEKQIYEITARGRTIGASGNHPFLVLRDERLPGASRPRYAPRWVATEDLAVGDLVAIATDVPDYGESVAMLVDSADGATARLPRVSNDDLCWFLGIYLGDGYLHHRGAHVAVEVAVDRTDVVLVEEIRRVAREQFGIDLALSADGFRLTGRGTAALARYLELNGFGGTSLTKRLPDWVHRLPRSQRLALLAGLLDADGYVRDHPTSKDAMFCSANPQLLADMKELLALSGIWSSSVIPVKNRHPVDRDRVMSAYHLRLSGDFDRIPARSPRRRERVGRRLYHHGYRTAKGTAFQSHTSEMLGFAKIEKFERVGVEPVFDIEVEGHHNFVAEGFVVHNSEVVFHRNREDLETQGVLFCDMDTAVREYPDIVRKWFGTIIPPNDNKFAALNSAVWSGGSFIYVPPGVKVDMPLQAYFRINAENMGQFERTLIIADEGSQVHYIEGCSAPVYTSDSLHSAVVELVALPGSRITYTTIQNWSNNVYNLVTKRARAEAESHVEWIDGNIGCLAQGSRVTTPAGTKPIELVSPGDQVLAYGEVAGELCFRTVTAKRFSGYQPVREVRVGERVLRVTDNHPFYSYRYDPERAKKTGRYELAYVRADELSAAIVPTTSLDYGHPHKLERPDTETTFVGSNQYARGFESVRPRAPRMAALEETTAELMWLFGLFVGDGSIEREPARNGGSRWARVTFSTSHDDRARPRLVELMRHLLPDATPEERRDRVAVRWSSVELADLFEENGFTTGAHRKRLPEWVLDLPEDQRLALVAGYLDSDGCAPKGRRGFSIKSVNRPLLADVAAVLTSLGIPCRIYTEEGAEGPVTILGYQSQCRGSHRLEFRADARLSVLVSEQLREAAARQTAPSNRWYRRVGRSDIVLPDSVEVRPVDARATGDVAPTWDIEVEGTGNFVSEGFIVHNSRLTMKYPSVYLVGPKASGEVLSVAYAGPGQHQDAGAKMVHAAPETSSTIVSKSISKDGGVTTYRGLVHVDPGAKGAKSFVRCDALLLDDDSVSETKPYMEVGEQDAQIGHEATVSKVGDDQLFYLMSRGLTESQAMGMIVNGFIEPVTRTLPMEYAVEWSRLIELQMEGSVG
ncbi:MAG TPA: SufD family Fe-S cluster assembly protein [Acidimicrobiales bacterium]|nr:SufD family Fe-S cluster assembly protein [Acidimicrobiales bacterium]